MINILVWFHRGDDHQYHIFTECKDICSIIFDPLFVAYTSHAYQWNWIEVPDSFIEICGLTHSIAVNKYHKEVLT